MGPFIEFFKNIHNLMGQFVEKPYIFLLDEGAISNQKGQLVIRTPATYHPYKVQFKIFEI